MKKNCQTYSVFISSQKGVDDCAIDSVICASYKVSEIFDALGTLGRCGRDGGAGGREMQVIDT